MTRLSAKRARAIGAWLQQQAAVGQRVLLLYPPGIQFIEAFFGCLYAGAIAVPGTTGGGNGGVALMARVAGFVVGMIGVFAFRRRQRPDPWIY